MIRQDANDPPIVYRTELRACNILPRAQVFPIIQSKRVRYLSQTFALPASKSPHFKVPQEGIEYAHTYVPFYMLPDVQFYSSNTRLLPGH